MENSNMYDEVKKLLDFYKKKVAENGSSSLTPEDIKNLKNMNSVMELIRGTALEMIVTKAIEGDFTSVETYYLEKEQEIIDKYAAYEQREQELSGELVDAISKGDKDAEEKIKAEFALIASEKAKFTGEMQQFKDSQLTPSDFVKKIIGDDTSKTLMTRVANRLIGTSDYIATPSFNYNVHFFEIDDEEVVINEPMVDLATEYIQGDTTNFDLLCDLRARQNQVKNLKNLIEGTCFIADITRHIRIYKHEAKMKEQKRDVLEKYRDVQTHFWTKHVKIDGNKVPIYTIKQAEDEYEKRRWFYDTALENLQKSYAKLESVCRDVGIEPLIPLERLYDARESEIGELGRFIFQVLEPAAHGKLSEVESEIEKIKAKIDPKYKNVDVTHIDRIVYYGRGRIDNPDNHTFDSTLEALKLLKYVSKINNKELKPEEVLKSSEISNVKQEATNVIDDYLAEQRRTL